MNDSTDIWDVVVIGGGPAGMMAAGRAAEKGARVLLIEKNNTLGKKLLITGGGRCNVTNSQFDNRKLLEKFNHSGKFLFSSFAQWSVAESLNFFHDRAMPTKIENELRTFPISNSAQSVWDVLVEYMRIHGVTVRSNSTVVGLLQENNIVTGAQLKNKTNIFARAIIIATGGTSRPETGSTGDGYAWLRTLGHTIIKPTASLVPLVLSDIWTKKLSGITVPNIKITILQNKVKQNSAHGKILFTHVGVSGPTILNMSKDIGELLKYGEVTLSLDLLPAFDHGTLNARLQELFLDNDKKKIRNTLTTLIPSALVLPLITLSHIDGETQCNSVTREDRLELIQKIKDLPLHVEKLLGVEKAIITSGGVSLEEIDFKTMRSKLFENLYIIGDMLDIDRPSGGYSLQLCWTTGFVAGNAVFKK